MPISAAIRRGLLFFALASFSSLGAQPAWFAGALGGAATLSADAASQITSSTSAAALYKPENGPALQLFGGVHFTDYISLEVNYVFNSNPVALTELYNAAGTSSTYQDTRDSHQHSVSADLMIYFRKRTSRIRPYLALGAGLIRFRSKVDTLSTSPIPPPPPPPEITKTSAAVRFPVGIDIALGHHWSLRYSFTETIRQNPLSAALTPPAPRHLAIYQNLVGFLKTF